jgi:hypothetical protein
MNGAHSITFAILEFGLIPNSIGELVDNVT